MPAALALIILAVAAWPASGCSKNEKSNTSAPKSDQSKSATTKDNAPTQAPDQYTVTLDTTQGPIVIDVDRAWSPRGADRFYELVQDGHYDDAAFFRVVNGFVAQAGISGDPAQTAKWRSNRIPDDPVKQSNTRGMVSFATSGPDSRSTQFFINYGDNSRLDYMGFSPFGKVRDMSAADALYSEYAGTISQVAIESRGNTYLEQNYPKLDYIKSAKITE